MPGAGKEGQPGKPTPGSRGALFSGEGFSDEGDSRVGNAPKGRLLNNTQGYARHDGRYESGVPSPRAESASPCKKRTSRLQSSSESWALGPWAPIATAGWVGAPQGQRPGSGTGQGGTGQGEDCVEEEVEDGGERPGHHGEGTSLG